MVLWIRNFNSQKINFSANCNSRLSVAVELITPAFPLVVNRETTQVTATVLVQGVAPVKGFALVMLVNTVLIGRPKFG